MDGKKIEQEMLEITKELMKDYKSDRAIDKLDTYHQPNKDTIIDITNDATSNCLVLLDELGAGTDPVEGAALAIAVVSYLKEKNIKTIVTSHYKELKEYAYATDGVNIAGMDFEPVTFKPTYKLLMGQTASSNALEIAKLLGLNENIVTSAKSLISEEDNKFNNIIRGAEINRREAQALKDAADKELARAQEQAKY